ncbi:transposase [Candidatus Nitrospira salsa]
MARPLRITFDGAWYHVMNRGAGRKAVFTNNEQREYFLALLAETSDRFNAEWHAYCLMDNHYHLLVRTPEANLQRIMRHLNGLYTQFYNRTEGRDGPLFRGRYKAILVEAQAYWTQLSRYIHRNPLEAGRVKRLDQYRWSSYLAYIGTHTRPPWLTCAYILKSLSSRRPIEAYKAFVAEGIDDEILEFYAKSKQPPVLGSDAFKQTLKLRNKKVIDVPDLREARVKPTVTRIIEVVGQRLNVNPKSIRTLKRGRTSNNPARGLAMYLCQREADMRLGEIAQRFGLKHYASASSSIRQFETRLAETQSLQRHVRRIKRDLARSSSRDTR